MCLTVCWNVCTNVRRCCCRRAFVCLSFLDYRFGRPLFWTMSKKRLRINLILVREGERAGDGDGSYRNQSEDAPYIHTYIHKPMPSHLSAIFYLFTGRRVIVLQTNATARNRPCLCLRHQPHALVNSTLNAAVRQQEASTSLLVLRGRNYPSGRISTKLG